MTDTRALLAAVPLFRNLSEEALDRLERIARTREYQPGGVIFQRGDEGVGVFVIIEGEVEIFGDSDTVLATVGPGDVLGEMAVIDRHLRSATVIAKVPTKCLAIARWDFIPELRANPELIIDLLRELSGRLRAVDERLAMA